MSGKNGTGKNNIIGNTRTNGKLDKNGTCSTLAVGIWVGVRYSEWRV